MPIPRRAFTKWTRTATDGTLSSIEQKKPVQQNISSKMLFANTVTHSRLFTTVTHTATPKPTCNMPNTK